MTEYLRMSGIYWGLTAMDLMGQLEVMSKSEVLEFVRGCQHPCGGISACVNHDPHLLHTLSAIQVCRYIQDRICQKGASNFSTLKGCT